MQFDADSTTFMNKIGSTTFPSIEEEDEWSDLAKDIETIEEQDCQTDISKLFADMDYSLDDIPAELPLKATKSAAEEARDSIGLAQAFARMDYADHLRRSIETPDVVCWEERDEDTGIAEWNLSIFADQFTGRSIVVLGGVVNLPPEDRMLQLLRDHRRERLFDQDEPSFLVPL